MRFTVVLLLSVLLLSLSCSPSLAAQSECNNGAGVHPCPSVSSTVTQWGISWRNYTQIGFAGKGIFAPPNSTSEVIEQAYPTLMAYFNGTNAAKAVLQRTVPILVLQEPAGNLTAYIVCFFLPDAYLNKVPGFVNATGFLHLNTWPTATAQFTPIVYSFLNRASNHVVATNTALLQEQLKLHAVDHYAGLTGFVSYGRPHGELQENEVWVFASNPFPGHRLSDVVQQRPSVVLE